MPQAWLIEIDEGLSRAPGTRPDNIDVRRGDSFTLVERTSGDLDYWDAS